MLCHDPPMTKLLLPSLLAALGVFSTLTAQDAPRAVPVADPAAAPQPPAKPAPAPPPGDPFVRDPKAPKPPVPPAKPEPPEPVINLLTTVETWALSQVDFAALLDGPANERAPYDRLEALAKAGKAKLVGLIGVNTKSGQRALVESVDEVRYPTQFSAAARTGEIAFPTAFETRNTGDTLEIEPVLGPDGKTIDVNLVPQSVSFEGFRDWQPEAKAAPSGQAQFRTEKVTTSMTVQSGRPAFLATATPAGGVEEKGGKQVRVRALRVAAQPAQPTAPQGGIILARVEALIYSLDRETARRILNETADSAQSFAAVRELVAKGEAQLEAVSALVTKSGQRAVNEEMMEFRYPNEANGASFNSQTPAEENRQPAFFTSFETRNVGLTLEIEPVFGPDARIVDINVVPQIVRMSGMLKADGVAAKYPPQPVFTTRKITTSVSSGAGVPVLLGTMSQPRDNGVNDRQDDGRTSLIYIRVTAVQP